MASSHAPEVEFHDLHRKNLLEALDKAAPLSALRPTVWACLWLCDIDRLQELVADAQRKPHLVLGFFDSIEHTAKLVPTCKLINSYPAVTE